MKKTILLSILTVFCLSAFAQKPAESLSLSDLTFVRQSFTRNFYNSSKTMASLNMEGTDLFLKNSNCLVLEGDNQSKLVQSGNTLVFSGEGKTSVRVGSFHPYLSYETSWASIPDGSSVGIGFWENEGEGRIEVLYCDGKISATRDGKLLSSAAVGALKDLNLRVQYTGSRFHVFRLRDRGEWDLLMSVKCDLRSIDVPVRWSFGVVAELPKNCSVTLSKALSALTCGTGQADPQVFQHKDGTPLIKDSRLWVAFTTRGFEQIPDSYQGIYSIDLDSYELRLEGAIFFGDGDGLIHGYHATKIVYDDESGKFLVMTTTHGGNHTLAWCETSADLLHGMHYLECTELDFPHNYTRGGKAEGKKECVFATEDPDFFYDAKARKWRLAYCARQGANADAKHLSYYTFLCESKSWNGPYRQMAVSPKDNNTGIRIVSVGGRRYVLSGGPDTTFYIYDYPTLEYVGTFNQKYENGGFRGWPTIVPLRYGNYERYLWITFDRGWITGRYSYGTLYFYLGDKMWRCE